MNIIKKIWRKVFPAPTMAGLLGELTHKAQVIKDEQAAIIDEQERVIAEAEQRRTEASDEYTRANNWIQSITDLVK